eukprot:Pgem_evm1s7
MSNLTVDDLQSQFEAFQTAYSSNLDQLFLLIMGFFVFMMQLGFAFLEAGSVRSKNTTNILLKNFMDPVTSAIVYWAFGFAFAYGTSGNAFIGHSEFFLANVSRDQYSLWFFQFAFAATCATIVSGAVAERCSFWAYIAYSAVLSGFVYPVGTHWAWSAEGFLAAYGPGFKDYAGSGVVHVVGGTSALIGAIALGPRIGRFVEGKDTTIAGHSTAFTALGGFILWVGFYAFNGGSQLAITNSSDANAVSLVVANTTLSGVAGGLVAFIIKFFIGGHYLSLLTMINGLLAGMVAICASCNAVEPWAAFVIGVIAGVVYTAWSFGIAKLKIDDPLDAVAVHLGCGMWGVLAGPLFANPNLAYEGVFYTGSSEAFKSFGWNLLGVLVYIAWTSAIMIPLFYGLKFIGLLRIDESMEVEGMDTRKHNEPAYPEYSQMNKNIEMSMSQIGGSKAPLAHYNQKKNPEDHHDVSIEIGGVQLSQESSENSQRH